MLGVKVAKRKDPRKTVATTRAWRLAHPEERRKQNARYYAGLRADPERYAKYLANRRQYNRARKATMRARTTWKCETPGERPDTKRSMTLEVSEVDRFLARLDRMASVIQSNQEKWGMDFTAAKSLVNAIDGLADDIETATYGPTSLGNRKRSLLGLTAKEVSTANEEEEEVHTKAPAGADDPARLAKANLCVALARLMLGNNPTPEEIEDQAFALMYVPDAELLAMSRRGRK